MSSQLQSTLLGVFLDVARRVDTVERNAVECADQAWTYGDLDVISTGIAIEMKNQYGLHPVVAVVSENHPYVLATLIAIWKLGGIVAPLDHHAPTHLMERMLLNIAPTCVVVPSTDRGVLNVVEGLKLSCLPFIPQETTLTALAQRFINQPAELPLDSYPLPSPEDIALYLHTSSASSVSNLKCVPLTHHNILVGSLGRVAWWKKAWPEQTFEHLRVLGWAPWSHVIGVSHDIGAATLLTKGCYVFALTPSTYHVEEREAKGVVGDLSIPSQLFDAAIKKNATAFAGVPWVVEGFMSKWRAETDEALQGPMTAALRLFKVIGSGGAGISQACIEWAKELSLPLVNDIGMTEVGGPLFHDMIGESSGYHMSDCFIPDAELLLIDEAGEPSPIEGELVILSRIISKGYLQFDSSAFNINEDGKITFHTGDIYEQTAGQCLSWKGRKEDFIQMTSSETLDPRVVENALNNCPVIAHSCVLGNNFTRGAAQFICAIIELTPEAVKAPQSSVSDVTRSIATVNRTLAPPLRIAWSRVLVLAEGEHIPFTKKGAIFRKKLEELFGDQIASLLAQGEHEAGLISGSQSPASAAPTRRTKDEIGEIVATAVAEALKLSVDILETNSEATFAELGMDSAMATIIVNSLNRRLGLSLPMNTCHTHIDLVALTGAICVELGLSNGAEAGTLSNQRQSQQALEDIVIVGQSLRLPGELNTPESFWEALIEKRDDLFTTVPEDRWDHKSFYRPPNAPGSLQPGDITFEKAGFIDIATFDNSFFGISSAEALHVAPAVRLTLETSFEALENANIPISRVKGTNMAVYVAAGVDEGYNKILFLEKGWAAYSRFYGTGVAISTACGRLSYLLDIHGPSLTVDTACSSGIVAFDEAVRYIQSGQGESAIVCGVNTHTWPGTFGFLSAQKMTSINSRCATFTKDADGYGASEGAIAVVLKSRSAALRDGDTILAVVRSTDVEHDGRSQGLVAPNVKAQIAMQHTLLEKASLKASQIDFIETHGTGTTLGDLIETQAINEVFRSSHTVERPLILGAAKTCVGHAEIAAGLVGVIKAIGSFTYGTVPGLVHLNADNMNPSIDCNSVPVHIPHETAPLKRLDSNEPFRTLILANGFAGTISGTILEEPERKAISSQASIEEPSQQPMLFVVSAKTQDGLTEYLRKYVDFCRKAIPAQFSSICYTSCVGREHYRYRFACVATDMEDLIWRLEEKLSSKSPGKSSTGPNRILFGFPGQGSQYQGMARELSERYSGFKSIIAEAANQAMALTGHPILSLLTDTECDSDLSIDQSEIAQICIFIFQYSMSRWLQTFGIQPQAVMGHSLGEIAAVVVAGALTFDQGLQFVVKRAHLLRADPENPGGMAAIAETEDVIMGYIDSLELGDELALAVYNGSKSHVISGSLAAVERLVAAVKSDGLRATKLNVDQGFHSPCISPALPALRAWLKENQHTPDALKIPLFSTALGKEVPKNQILNPHYWVMHAQNPVKFYQAAIEVCNKDSIDVILDVGPQPTVWSNLQTAEFSGKTPLTVVAKRSKSQETSFLGALSKLFENGLAVDFLLLYSQVAKKYTSTQIPTYPFQRQRHYPTYVASRDPKAAPMQMSSVLVPQKEVHAFQVDQALCDMLDEHRIEGRRVLPGAASVDFFARSSKAKSVKMIRFHQPLVLETPDNKVHGEVDASDNFILYQGGSDGSKICSGSVARKVSYTPKYPACGGPPSRTLAHGEVYECFNNVQFGNAFRNIQDIKIWADHADAYIDVKSTAYPMQDRIRKLDSCLHMFGAIAAKEVPHLAEMEGAFLPASLEDFTLHSDNIPSSFICRYFLPLDVSRNSHVITVSFEVLSHDEELLVSCKKYSVAWVPAGVVIQDSNEPSKARPWLFNRWDTRSLTESTSSEAPNKFEELLYVGTGPQPRLLPSISTTAQRTVCVDLPGTNDEQKCIVRYDELATPLGPQLDELGEIIKGSDLSIVVDLTSIDYSPESPHFASSYRHILTLMKLLIARRTHISSFVVLSSMSVPVYVSKGGFEDPEFSNITLTTSVGAIVQGMLRVFRRETSIDNVVWGIDLPALDTVPDSALGEVVLKEIQSRQSGAANDTIVAYRSKQSNQSLARLVPVMEYIERSPTVRTSGTGIVVGMGSIGYALASGLISSGCSHVVFLGRRSPSDAVVNKDLSVLQTETQGRCSYVQVDISDQTALRAAFMAIQSRDGAIEHIVHTAAVINDSAISNVTISAFEDVLRPKVTGAWNLHVISEELSLPLKSFIMLSSIQVLLGNPGQVAYVSGNSFMDSLAAHRHSRGLPGTSLQLGVWESKLLENIDLSEGFVHLIYHKEGVPLILQAASLPIPVQVIADWDIPKLTATPAYSKDPFFAAILPSQASSESVRDKIKKADISGMVSGILRSALELRPSEELDLEESLTSCGIDSIGFAQIRGRVLKELEVEVPMVYLSDAYSINDMIANIAEHF
ncbi:hypothetical protein BDQ12DRAFT_116355 [Crucibulum laeve]|uniref:Polyketide synthase n=1 Tax=Crucibulum laeve TaxID=68775 RepID=A0A5C3M1F7_9AGAR|nr:hypothetical protein BDQ12DRAFT_116355 [Crucibulum laeve]